MDGYVCEIEVQRLERLIVMLHRSTLIDQAKLFVFPSIKQTILVFYLYSQQIQKVQLNPMIVPEIFELLV